MRLIVATKNKSKMEEIRNILSDISFELACLDDLSKRFEINENGKTFYENAKKKALVVSRVYRNDYVVGEDSGLEVEHLGKEPGIYSKRYSGENATALKNNYKLLNKLKNLPMEKRKAKFISYLVLAKNDKEIASFQGKLEGFIHYRIEGQQGFGYDPLFFLPAFNKTVAQLEPGRKDNISHRFKAFMSLKKFVRENV